MICTRVISTRVFVYSRRVISLAVSTCTFAGRRFVVAVWDGLRGNKDIARISGSQVRSCSYFRLFTTFFACVAPKSCSDGPKSCSGGQRVNQSEGGERPPQWEWRGPAPLPIPTLRPHPGHIYSCA